MMRKVAVGAVMRRRVRGVPLAWGLVLALVHAAPANPASVDPPGAGPGGPPPGSAASFGRALVQRLKPAVGAEELWPLGEPPPGGLDSKFHGYLRPERVSEPRGPELRIPSVLHRIMFFEKDDMSEAELKRAIDKRVWLVFGDSTMLNAYTAWETKNKVAGFSFKSYNLQDAEAYIEEHFEQPVLEAFQGLQPFAYKADLFRYLVLYMEGGWYVDLKLEPVGVSLNELLERVARETGMSPVEVGFVGARQNFSWNVPGAEGIINSFLGAKARHPLLGDTIVRIVRQVHECRKGLTPWCLSGLLNAVPSMTLPCLCARARCRFGVRRQPSESSKTFRVTCHTFLA